MRFGRWVGGNAVWALLAASAFLLIAAVGLAARVPAQAASSAPADSGPHWITLRSQGSRDIIAAVRQSALFTVDRSGRGDYLKDLSHTDTPQLVTELRVRPGSPGTDCYVVPILNASGATVGVAVAWLNQPHNAVYVGYIRAYDAPLAQWTGPLPTADQAVAIVGEQHHAALAAHARPQLIYFPFDFSARFTGKLHWDAGGEGPDTPVWLVPGSDGQSHVVGRNGKAYHINELPLNPQAP